MAATRVLALDVGTSSVRARVYDEAGRPLAGVEAQTRYEPTHGHDGHAEFDAEHLVDVTRAALEEARREAGGAIDAVAASCFWHSLLAVDACGRVLGPLLTWRDTRAAAAARHLGALVDREAVYARTGCPLHPSFWPAKLAWLRETEPDLFAAAARFVSFDHYLYEQLVGAARTSLSMASGTGLLDLEERVWDGELLEALEVEPERLPELGDEPVEADSPWFPALGDGACSNVGAGCLTRDRAALMIGTSGAYRVLCEAGQAEPRDGLFLYRLDERRFVAGGSLSDGGNLYAWLARTLSIGRGSAVAELGPDSHGLTFLPLLGGERSPGWNAAARGAVAGLSFDTEPEHLVRAALEGVAFRFADVAELLPGVREVVATGHALLASDVWAQILADVLERPLTRSAVDEASLRGAAVVTLERLGETPEPAPLGAVVEPRPECFETYRSARARQRELYRKLT